MSEEDQSGEKEFEPTQRKLDEQRRKGEVPRSTDLNTAAAFAGLALSALALGGISLTALGDSMMVLFDQAPTLAPLFAQSGQTLSGGLLVAVAVPLLPLFVVPFLLVLASLFAQRAVIFAPEKLKPKGSRISPISNAKNKYGRNGLFEFAKSFVKLLVISGLLWVFVLSRLERIVATVFLAPGLAVTELLWLVIEFLGLVFVIMLVIGGIDFFWQRAEHFRKNRMSHKEMRDEHKQVEGDPHAKQQRRQRGAEIASNQMLARVAEADVVITNPTHYAVALKWDRSGPGAPVCVAKGVDEIAARIRERAEEAGVPIHADPPTARALHATVDLEAEIAPEHYQPVAAAIRFAEAMRSKARGRWQP
ncbi:flagellar biosynthesis protein FlhB [Rhodobacteraceae bacterium 2376]|uniref:Flagellar biosynthesis protein FlhB n=1 Tax=Rhabdonatronobacter sediminivivens TaxID=2743469 RepID=A0A7Z0HXZ1_9RHOB|nr:flagellar type III secretion system protein FlhB [Rhabdonatronobacter sediminivivens]NYS24122.1 flagellar biosynthesis protein FlhB [Rhabdonatronobacter sediminivivens]